MPPIKYGSIAALEDNNNEIYMGCTEVLLRIAGNILKEPANPKYRSISLGSNVVTNKLLPASGAMECLFDMGFQEGSGTLVLPADSSLECVKYIYDELQKRRELRKHTPVEKEKTEDFVPVRAAPNPLLTLVAKEITVYIRSLNNQFFDKFIDNILDVWRCESIPLQLKALKCVPLVELKTKVERGIRETQMAIKKKVVEDQVIDYQEFLLVELCKWFKSSFFSWVNKPECNKCGNENTEFKEKNPSTTSGLSTVEVYTCTACKETVLFPRYRDAEKLLQTRRGRCGEWAHCFYLICRSLGWDVRFVVDETDHVWVEVYSHIKKRWIHCDPCETLVDAPLVYECGWKKNLSYIMAYSKDEIQDVTWRYSCDFAKVLRNRQHCREEQLVDVICHVNRILSGFGTEKRKEFVLKRTALELVDLLVSRKATDAEKQGRTSGSLAWRLARGDISLAQTFTSHTWRLDKKDLENMKFVLSYCTSSDKYTAGDRVVEGWNKGLYRADSVFRKEEQDWKMTYLARQEGTDKGTLSWRFETEEDVAIGEVQLRIVTQTYENGRVFAKMCSETTCVCIPNDDAPFATSDFAGSRELELVVELSGGRSENAWQHAQLLRQSLSDKGNTFEIVIKLIPRPVG